jgi:ABC-type branched-subunit amino acid transport system substrate-binding protein
MFKRIRISLLWLTVLVMMATFTSITRAAPPLQSTDQIRIGVLLIPNSDGDLGARLAVSELNERGLINYASQSMQFELVYPNQLPNQPDGIPRIIEILNSQGVHAMLGPSVNQLALPNLEPLARAGVPVLTLATADTLTDLDVTNNIMRMRAAEGYYSHAIIDYMINDLALTNIALIQTDVESTEALVAAETRLAEFGRAPAIKIQLEDSSTLEEQLQLVIDSGADGVAMWGPAADAGIALPSLRSHGWTGRFFHRKAQEALISGTFTNLNQAAGTLGANGWSFGNTAPLSRLFVANYAATYGRIPSDEAAAAYDAIYALAGQVQVVGKEMPIIYETMREMATVFTVQGRLAPTEYGNGDFSRQVTLYEIRAEGGVRALARYDGDFRLPEDDPSTQTGSGLAAIGTPTFTPSPSPSPTITPTITGTPSQLQLTVLAESISVFGGPGDFFEELGLLEGGTSATIVGADQDLTWLVIQYRGGIGWVLNDPAAISIFDPGGLTTQLPVIEAPPTPQGGVTPTPALEVADIVIENVTMTPPRPVPGQPFLANVSLRNVGSVASGPFTVGASFEPGAVYSSNVIPNIQPGSSVSLPLSATVVGTGDFSVDVVADVNNEVSEGFDGETNNFFRFSYGVDYPIVGSASSLPINAGTPIDLAGGTPELNWTGASLDVVNGALIGIITGVTYENVVFDQINPNVVNNGTGLTDAQLFPGVLVGVRTAEGQRAIVRIDARNGTTLTISFRVYGG